MWNKYMVLIDNPDHIPTKLTPNNKFCPMGIINREKYCILPCFFFDSVYCTYLTSNDSQKKLHGSGTMQNNKQKMIEILVNELNYCYCDNCKFSDYNTYGDRYCDNCHRKYQNWALSPAAAEKIIDKIIQFGEIYPISIEELKETIYNVE